MGAHNSKTLDDIINILKIFKDAIKDISDGVRSVVGFELTDKAVVELSKVSSQFTAEQKEALNCIIATNKKVTLAMNHAKDVVSDAKRLASTLKEVMNSKAATGNDNKVRLATIIFEKNLTDMLPKLLKARDDLSVAITELQEIVLKLCSIKNWCLAKKQELENQKGFSVAKTRVIVYGCATGATLVCAGLIVGFWWTPAGWISALVLLAMFSAGTASLSSIAAATVVELETIPQVKKMYNEGIIGLEEALNKFQEMSDGNEERSIRLSEKLDQLREITSVAQLAKGNASLALVYIDDIMFNVLKKDVEDLESLCDNYLKN